MTSSYPIVDATHDNIRIDIIVRHVDETLLLLLLLLLLSTLQVDFDRCKRSRATIA